MPFFSPIVASLYKQYYTNSISDILYLNKSGWTPMVLSARLFMKVGKSNRHKIARK